MNDWVGNDKILGEALELERQFEELTDKQGRLLDPVLDRAADMDDDELLWWVQNMPGGFHRCEMRGIIRRRKGDEWCIEQGIMVRMD